MSAREPNQAGSRSRAAVAALGVAALLLAGSCGVMDAPEDVLPPETAAEDRPRPANDIMLGVNFCDWEDRFITRESFAALEYLRTLEVSHVVVVPTWYQKTASATSIHRLEGRTPGDAGVRAVLTRARELGFSTGLKLHIDPEDGAARSSIAFASAAEFEQWWSDYRAITLHYAGMAADCATDLFSVGCELSGVAIHPYTEHWVLLIRELRDLFGANGPKLTYSARHQNVANIGFLAQLDCIGINTWPYLHDTGSVSVQNVRNSWGRALYFPAVFPKPGGDPGAVYETLPEEGYDLDFFGFLRTLSDLYGKPLMLTELGCQSKQGVLHRPVDWWAAGNPDVLSQAVFFRGFFDAVLADRAAFEKERPGEPYPLTAVLIWNYMIKEAGPADSDYTPRNKPLTEQVLRDFARRARRADGS